MARFKDREGREWVVRIDVWGIGQVKERTGFNIGQLPLESELEKLNDSLLLAEVLWVLCEDQANGTDRKKFLQSFDGDAIDAASKAFEEAFLDFCPSRLREAIRNAQTAKTSSGSATSLPESSESIPQG